MGCSAVCKVRHGTLFCEAHSTQLSAHGWVGHQNSTWGEVWHSVQHTGLGGAPEQHMGRGVAQGLGGAPEQHMEGGVALSIAHRAGWGSRTAHGGRCGTQHSTQGWVGHQSSTRSWV